MKLSERLFQIIADQHLLKHPYYQAWSMGKLNQEILRDYAAQYYQHVSCFPRFISRVHAECPEIAARKILLSNLVDEEIHGTDHPELWMQFAEGLGASRSDVKNTVSMKETQNLINTFSHLAAQDWRDGLCALFAYESQVPEVSASKIDGLKKFYGITDERTLAFFVAHQEYDVEHTKQVAQLVDQYANPEQAEKATKAAASALWGFLDGICHKAGISC